MPKTKRQSKFKCKEHPTYKAIYKPRVYCEDCRTLYEKKHPGFKFPCSICHDTGWMSKSDCHYDTWFTECTYCEKKPTTPYPGNY